MGNINHQINQFKQQIKSQTQTDFEVLSHQIPEVNSNYLISIFKYVENIPTEKLAKFECGRGEVFERRNTNEKFSFYVGRDFDGDFHLILTPNGKTPDGTAGVGSGVLAGAYKYGKKAPKPNFPQLNSELFYRLTCENIEANAEGGFSRMVNSPFVLRYFQSAPYSGYDKNWKSALFAPFAHYGSLIDVLRDELNNKLQITKVQKLGMIFAILAGLRHFHNSPHLEKPVRHRDIKPWNMVVLADFCLQYIDFGGWQKPDRDARSYEYCPPEYIEADYRLLQDLKGSDYKNSYSLSFWNDTPEDVRKNWDVRDSGARGDVWGAGMTIYSLLFNCKIASLNGINSLGDKYSFLKGMLQADPVKRLNSDAALIQFLKDLTKHEKPVLIQEWLVQIMGYYKTDFHRMQFFSELHAAGCEHILDYLDEKQRLKMPFEKCLDWPHHLSVSEWLRIRNFYRPSLSPGDLLKFDIKLGARKEFDKDLLEASLKHAKRVCDLDVVKKYLAENQVNLLNNHLQQSCAAAKTSAEKLKVYQEFYNTYKANLPAVERVLWDAKLKALQRLRIETPAVNTAQPGFRGFYRPQVLQSDVGVAYISQKIIEMDNIQLIEQILLMNPQYVRFVTVQPVFQGPNLSPVTLLRPE